MVCQAIKLYKSNFFKFFNKLFDFLTIAGLCRKKKLKIDRAAGEW